jgi:ubiquinol-cytochrome c reductase cytochrome c subunit
MKTWILVMLAALVLAAAGAGAQTPAQTPAQIPPAGDAAAGKKLFVSLGCWTCHGYEGQGGAGPRIAPRPLPRAAFTTYVRRPPERMPSYPERLVSDAELGDIHAYLQSRPMPPPVASIPLLQP